MKLKFKIFLILSTLVLFLGSFLRLYKLDDRTILLDDHAREFLLVYKLVNYKEIIWNGPAVSGILALLSPIYYYLITPFFLITNYHPLTLHYLTSSLDILALITLMHFLHIKYGMKASLVGGFLYAINFIFIKEASMGWNPSFLPLFTFLLLISVHKVLNSDSKYLLLISISLSMLLSLHASGFFYYSWIAYLTPFI